MFKPLFCILFTSVLAVCTRSNVALGVALDSSHPEALMSAIMHAYRSGSGQIVIPHGVYKLPEPRGGFYLSFKEMKNFRIVGKGVTLLRTDPTKGGILFDHCSNVTLEGFTLRCDPLPYTQGRVIALSDSGALSQVVRICRGYRNDLASFSTTTVFGSKTRRIWPGETPISPQQIKKIGRRTFRLTPFYVPCKVGDWEVFRGAGASDLAILACHHMCIERITIMGGTGYCFGETGGQGGNLYIDDSILYPPAPRGANSPPILAACSDGLHSNSVRHGPTVLDCHFEGTGDDSLAIQGWYAIIQHASGRNWVAEFPANVGTDYCKKGDLLSVTDSHGTYLGSVHVVRKKQLIRPNPRWQARPSGVVGAAFPGDLYNVTVSTPINHAAFGDRINDVNTDGSGFIVRGCVIRHGYSRGMVIKADNGVIEDNTVDSCANGDIVLSPEPAWDESGNSSGVLIEGNLIRSTGYVYPAQPDWNEAGALSIIGPTGPHPNRFGHRGIAVVQNHFIGNSGINLLLTDCQNVIVADNIFSRAMRSFDNRGQKCGYDPSSLIYLQQCNSVLLAHNCAIAPGPAMKKLLGIGPDVSNVKGIKAGVKTIPAVVP